MAATKLHLTMLKEAFHSFAIQGRKMQVVSLIVVDNIIIIVVTNSC